MKRLLAIAGKSMAFPSYLKVVGLLYQAAAISIDSTQKDLEVASRMSSLKNKMVREVSPMNKSSTESLLKDACVTFCSAHFCFSKPAECFDPCSEMCAECSCYSKEVCRPHPVDQAFLEALKKDEKGFWGECREFCHVARTFMNRGDPQEGRCIEEKPAPKMRHKLTQDFVALWNKESGKEEL